MNALLAVYLWSQVAIPGKNVVQQFGINDRGQTVVTSDDGTSGIYDHRRFTPLPAPPASCSCTITGVAVNDGGVVVGLSAPSAGGPEQGFILSGSVYTFFSWPGWDNTEPRGISSQGLVVGWAFSNDFTRSAGFVYDPSSGTFTNVTPGSGYPSIVQGINRFGRVAGTFIQPSPRRVSGLVAQPGETSAFGAAQLPFVNHFQVAGVGTRARGINDFGIVVGWVSAAGGGFTSFVGNDSWGYQFVFPPGSDLAGRTGFCTGINNRGQLACSVTDNNFSQTYGLYIGTPGSDEQE